MLSSEFRGGNLTHFLQVVSCQSLFDGLIDVFYAHECAGHL